MLFCQLATKSLRTSLPGKLRLACSASCRGWHVFPLSSSLCCCTSVAQAGKQCSHQHDMAAWLWLLQHVLGAIVPCIEQSAQNVPDLLNHISWSAKTGSSKSHPANMPADAVSLSVWLPQMKSQKMHCCMAVACDCARIHNIELSRPRASPRHQFGFSLMSYVQIAECVIYNSASLLY